MNRLNLILLVDDDHVTNYLNQDVLQQLDIVDRIEVRNNGEEGLEFIRQCLQKNECPDLILVDLKMPVMDGFELVAALKALNINSVIAMLTTSTNPRDIDKIKQVGVEDVIIKPLDEAKLYKLLKKYFSDKVKLLSA